MKVALCHRWQQPLSSSQSMANLRRPGISLASWQSTALNRRSAPL